MLSYLFLGIKTSNKNWLALIVGFIGVVLVLKPGGGVFHFGLFLALLAGLSTAVAYIGVHELAKYDSAYTIMFYYFLLTFVFSGILVLFDWHIPDKTTVLILIMLGVVGTAYQELLTRALLYAPPKVIAPISYLSIGFSGVLGWTFWGYIPDWYFMFGMILIVLGCIFSIKYAKKSLTPTSLKTS